MEDLKEETEPFQMITEVVFRADQLREDKEETDFKGLPLVPKNLKIKSLTLKKFRKSSSKLRPNLPVREEEEKA